MSFDIYGNDLLPGHCEVHPHINEEYPCSVCVSERGQYEQSHYCDGDPSHCESSHLLGQATEHIRQLDAERDRLKARIEALEAALNAIVNPITHLQKEAEREGYMLNGGAAVSLASNAEFLKGIALEALLQETAR